MGTFEWKPLRTREKSWSKNVRRPWERAWRPGMRGEWGKMGLGECPRVRLGWTLQAKVKAM